MAHNVIAADSEYTSVMTEISHIIFPDGKKSAEIAETIFENFSCRSIENKNIVAIAPKNADIRFVAITGGFMDFAKIYPSNVYSGYPVG